MLTLALLPLAAAVVRLESQVPIHDPQTSSWIKQEKPVPSERVTLTVALRVGAGRDALERVFWQVSDPQHAEYGHFRTIKQIADILAVPAERVARVSDYFAAAGAGVEVSPTRDTLKVTMNAAEAEAALHTSLHWFGHREQPHLPRIIRASAAYALPEAVAAEVIMVGELLQFPRVRDPTIRSEGIGRGLWPNSCDSVGCTGLVTPEVLAERYKLPPPQPPTVGGPKFGSGGMAVAEFQFQYFRAKDIMSFSESCHRNVTVSKVIGGNRPTPGVEAELDIEYIKSVAPEVPLTVIYSSSYSLLNWCDKICALADPPTVHSVSYGNDEAQQTSPEFMYTANTAFMKAGARGISILFASGDQGVCGREGCGIFKKKFHPDFPAASPYITAVGGTDFLTNDIGGETAWRDSGGGFSNTFGTPPYQASAVQAYLASPDANLPPSSMWNSTGRGYPDVSALGGTKAPYCVCTGGNFAGVAGTSASSPVVAGVFALLNKMRADAGKLPLGFLNPWIYQNAAAWQDVTSGKNSASGLYGFTAVKGWDAATGFGTPDFEALSKAAMMTK